MHWVQSTATMRDVQIFSICLLLWSLTLQVKSQAHEESLSRTKRFLGLFNVIQFANEMCNGTSNDNLGVCYTSSECSNMGGEADGVCAQGFGVCCVFEYNCRQDGDGGAQDVFYFQNEDFPQESNMPTMCIFNIQVQDSNICQLRLDFLEFEMDGGSSIDKPCDRDAVEIFSGSSNGLGNGRLCGQNTNQHLYIPIDSSQSRPMIRVITDGRFNDDDTFTSTGYKFRIRVMQLDCSSREERIRELVAPNGCLQYFTKRRGSVTSFNWDPLNRRQYVPDQRYSICFRRQPSDCRLELKRSRLAPAFSTSVGKVPLLANQNIYSNNVCGPENGCGVKECTSFSATAQAGMPATFNDYLQISAAYRKQEAANNPNQEIYVLSSYYCGAGVGRDAERQATQDQFDGDDEGTGIISDGPFILTFNADANPGVLPDAGNQNQQQQSEALNELGFSLDYRLSTSCPDLTFGDSN